ncbi:MAG: hypothetical protein QM817_24040 [Archangium sp.]
MTAPRPRKHLLVVHDPPNLVDPLRSSIFPRSQELDAHFVETIDHARDELHRKPWDAVLLRAGIKRLSLESFRKLAASSNAKLLVIDDDVPGYERIEGDTGEHIVDQVFAHLGIARSVTFDSKVLHSLGSVGAATLEHIEYPGIGEPVIRARIDRHLDLVAAQRAAMIEGPGLASTLEVFWDDPRPHLLQVVPPGVTLERLLRSRSSRGYGKPDTGPGTADALGLAVLRAVLPGVKTLHAAQTPVGSLSRASVWLTTTGEALLLARGMAQLTVESRTPGHVPPSEYRLSAPDEAPRLTGDAFRLGVLLLETVLGDNPFFMMGTHAYAERRWQPQHLHRFDELGSARSLAVTLLAPRQDGPIGAELISLVEEHARGDAAALLRDAVKAALAVPDRPW